MSETVYREYVGFSFKVKQDKTTGAYVCRKHPQLIAEIVSVLPQGASFVPYDDGSGNDPIYYGVEFGEHFMFVFYDNPALEEYDSVDDKDWGEVVEAVLTKMDEIGMKLFGEPMTLED